MLRARLCRLVSGRLTNFYMFMAYSSPRTLFLDEILLLIVCLPKHAHAAGASTRATLQEAGREETNGQRFVPHWERLLLLSVGERLQGT